MPLILATTSKPRRGTVYADVTGSSYEYPKMYVYLVEEGEDFIYYRPGVGHRVYFGSGRIGPVSPSPNDSNRLVCAISAYRKFPRLVPLKDVDSRYFEDTSPGPIFKNGVRAISVERFHRILDEANQ